MAGRVLAKILFVAFLGILFLAGQAQAGQGTVPMAVLSFGSPVIPAPDSQSFTVPIMLTDAEGVWGIDLTITYSPTLISITQPTLTPGTCPLPGLVIANQVNAQNGTLRYAAVQLNGSGQPPCQGGRVASFEALCLGSQNSLIFITQSDLSTQGGDEITHVTQPVEIRCLAGRTYFPLILSDSP